MELIANLIDTEVCVTVVGHVEGIGSAEKELQEVRNNHVSSMDRRLTSDLACRIPEIIQRKSLPSRAFE